MILVTGASGFVGFHLSQRLLKERHEVHGLDVLNDYYEVSLKEARTEILKGHKGYTFHKVDLADAGERRAARQSVPDALFVSARTGEGIAALKERCRELIADGHGAVQLLIPLDRYDIVARLHEFGHVQEQEHREDGVLVTGRFPPSQAGALEPFLFKSPKSKRKARA